jgi:hypothetical protein
MLQDVQRSAALLDALPDRPWAPAWLQAMLG